MNKQTKILQRTGLALLMSLFAGAAFAADIAAEQVAGGLYLTPTVNYDTASLRVSSDDIDVTTSFATGEAISFANNGMDDGTYSYELTLVSTYPSEEEGEVADENSVTQSGSFQVTNGVMADNSAEEQAAEADAIENQVRSDPDMVSTDDQ